MKRCFWLFSILFFSLAGCKTVPVERPRYPEKTVRAFVIEGPATERAILKKSFPDYPADAQQNNWTGDTAVQFAIEESGAVSELQLVKSCGYPTLDELALKAAGQWQFEPRAGVRTLGTLHFHFGKLQPRL